MQIKRLISSKRKCLKVLRVHIADIVIFLLYRLRNGQVCFFLLIYNCYYVQYDEKTSEEHLFLISLYNKMPPPFFLYSFTHYHNTHLEFILDEKIMDFKSQINFESHRKKN